uniref:Uncharacterized protein n=1 Tax=Corethron hystrix TaxID=216773 RepID=A0A7S1BME8_9STRA|mmetsp:Transcript_33843/g.78146  ORF Transcript_33843/g.78146 Transcript_33843/m.78146 type:complete len:114 (+) Transcript_33843:1159-1500(+)
MEEDVVVDVGEIVIDKIITLIINNWVTNNNNLTTTLFPNNPINNSTQTISPMGKMHHPTLTQEDFSIIFNSIAKHMVHAITAGSTTKNQDSSINHQTPSSTGWAVQPKTFTSV